METKTQIRWKKMLLPIALWLVVLCAVAIAYDKWRVRNGWCVRFSPDGDKQVLYGDDCWR
jgi:hypothetical protein